MSLERIRCAGCGYGGLDLFAELGATPLADEFAPTKMAALRLPRYPLRAARCERCGLAQLLDLVNDDVLYGESYGFHTGSSPSTLAYMHNLARDAVAQRKVRGEVVEIGSNDGTLLVELQAMTGEAMGVDPSVASLVAIRRGLRVAREPFTAEWAKTKAGKVGLVVAVNVAAHVQDPHDFLEGIRTMVVQGGVAVVEFQYLPDLLTGLMFDLVYHEHRFFYTVESFGHLASGHGLSLTWWQHTPQQGGSVRVVLQAMPDAEAMRWKMPGQEPNVEPLMDGFQERAEYARDRIREAVHGHEGMVAGYAASAKSCTLLNWCGFGADDLTMIVDLTPGKIGRYSPGTGFPIVGPSMAPHPDAYLLLASNYLGGIVRREQAKGYKGQFIVPLPLPVIV